jgi:hypothetical protein
VVVSSAVAAKAAPPPRMSVQAAIAAISRRRVEVNMHEVSAYQGVALED